MMSSEQGLYLSLAALGAALLALIWTCGALSGALFGSGWAPIPLSSLLATAMRLPSHLGDPRAAWPPGAREALPGAVGFYATGGLLLAVYAGLAALVQRVVTGLDLSTLLGHRPRAPAARWARGRDLAPLSVRSPEPTRLTLGRIGRRLLAARERESVIVFGPTETHKTSGLAIPALLEWEGPALATSVKSDLLGVTLARREALGEVMVFDPAQVTGVETTRATPLRAATDWGGALEVAHWLASAARSGAGGLHDADFWYSAAEKLLQPLLFAAASGGRTMEAVVRWLDEGPEQISVDVEALLRDSGEKAALRTWRATQNREERQRSSIYTTAEMIVSAFADPRVIEETSDADYSPERLLSGDANTLYICAPRQQQERLRPLFAMLVQELMAEVETRELRNRRPLDPPLLLLLDECANIAPVPGLDEIASTAAALGVQLLTIFQDLSQVQARWGRRSGSIVNNHRAKVIGTAISDTQTLDYVSRLLGAGEFEQRSTSTSSGERGRRSETQGDTYRELAPANFVRERKPGTALLVDAELPPAQIMLRPWFEDQALCTLRHADGVTA
jgi:type IV secretion system protein VirD4